jgi:allophanate hydrolase subunit 2
LLAQCRPGVKIQFREIGEEESEISYINLKQAINRVKFGLKYLNE